MKHFYLKNIILCLCLLASTDAFAYSAKVNGIYYNFSGTEAEVTYGSTYNSGGVYYPSPSYSGSVVIPSSVTYGSKTYRVTGISNVAFYECTNLTSVTIPNSVTSIGATAFHGCSRLASVNIPNGVTSIRSTTFDECKALTSITIPSSVIEIGNGAFSRCTSLTSVAIPNSVTSIDHYAFGECIGLTSVTIGSGITSFDNTAFQGCDNITSVTLYCKEIGSWFRSKSSIKNVVIGNGVTCIGENAFSYCSGLTSLTISNTVTDIGYNAFNSCKALTSLTIPNSVTNIGNSAFYNCSGLTSASIPNSVTSMGNSVFSNCSGLTSVSIPNSVTSISDETFRFCSNLTSVVIPESVTSIGESAFYSCSKLTSVTIPNSVTSIGSSAFSSCYKLSSIVIPSSVTSIGSAAFQYCNTLTYVKVENETPVTIDANTFSNRQNASLYVPTGSEGAYAAADYWKEFKTIKKIAPEIAGICYNLDSDKKEATIISSPDGRKYEGEIVIPSTITHKGETYCVTGIGEKAFYYCSGLTSVTIPSSVISIGDYSFSGCTGLTTVAIPGSVLSVGNYAFQNCTGLTSVTISNGAANISYNAFNGCSNITSLNLDCELVSNWFSRFSQLQSLILGEHVKEIGNSAFYNCTSLTSITFPNSLTSIGGYAFYGTAWENNLPDGLAYVSKIAYKYKGTMPEGTKISIKEGTLGIADNAFSGCTGLTSVNIPNSVVNIGNSAFGSCTGLTHVTIPNGVTRIGDCAFGGCKNLVFVIIPQSVTYIGAESFLTDFNLAYVIVEAETPIENNGFIYYNRNATLFVPAGCKAAYAATQGWNGFKTIKEGLPKVVDGIYYNLDNEKKEAEVVFPLTGEKYQGGIAIPSSVTYQGATYSVTSIGTSAFYGCSDLTSVTIPESVTSIGSFAFYNCTGLRSVIVERRTPVTIVSDYYTEVIYNVFYGCWYATLYVPAGCKEAYTNAEGWNVFKAINEQLPTAIEGLYYSFDNANKVAEVTASPYGDKYKGNITIPSSVAYKGEIYNVTSIDSLAFQSCDELTSIVVPNGVSSIGLRSFWGCSGLTSVTIPNSVTDIGWEAFYGCSSLTSVTIPNSVTSIGSAAFYNCKSLTSVTISNGLKNISYGSFQYCSSLTSITIPDGVTIIEGYAFYGCENLGNITIPESVTSIGYLALHGTVWFNNQLGGDGMVYAGKVAYSCKGLPNQITIRDGTVGISTLFAGYKMPQGGNPLTSVTIPSSVKNINYDAFESCNNLTTVRVGMTTPVWISSSTFPNRTNATLYVPAGCKAAYAAANYWKEFKEIIEEIPQVAGLYYNINRNNKTAEVTYAPDGSKYAGDIIIPESIEFNGETYSVTSIGYNAFYQCSSLSSVTIPASMMSINSSAFTGSYYVRFYASRGTDGLLAVWNYGATPYETGTSWQALSRPSINVNTKTQTTIKYSIGNMYSDLEYEFTGESIGSNQFQITGLRPETTQYISVTVHSAHNTYTTSTTVTTAAISPDVSCENVTASSITVKGVCKIDGHPNVISRKLIIDGTEMDGIESTIHGLDPNTTYSCKYKLVIEYSGGYRYNCEGTKDIKTEALTLTTQQSKTISEGNVIVCAESNLDDEETNVGFEWRRIDWTDEFDSKSGGAYLYEGTMEGYIRSINSNYLWKFRPYYTSNTGNTYYGEWKGMDPSDYSYFEPTVHTYASINVTGNSAEVKGYAMRGTDKVTSQGFMYWENTSSYSLRKKAASIPADAKIVEVKGNVMTATLEGLEYEREYCYVAFVTTEENETFFGEVQTFSTDVDPDGIEEIKDEELRMENEVSWYDLSGRKLDKPQRGINIIRNSDGTTRKVLVK